MDEDEPMTPPGLSPEELDELLAAELALGLLDGDEAQLLMARLAGDEDFARRVQEWQGRFAGIADGLVPVMPPARARQRIREELGLASAPFSQPLDSRIRWWQRPGALLSVLVVLLGLAALVFWAMG
ncbi:hypothetical protein RGQ15_01005 [Paracoccus sp. MBLB3053]|uniref:Anti-sigma factor n=1 Tax=Paracoccus aurantius TaxID=3073814 RepID=A0ABU2HN13_9RHOB|nr:hypothetical protein [Paracoccus sp. MBLB3053]MDS9466157.1 hypothetical protein [Paracoccus sp. MBLB3053]